MIKSLLLLLLQYKIWRSAYSGLRSKQGGSLYSVINELFGWKWTWKCFAAAPHSISVTRSDSSSYHSPSVIRFPVLSGCAKRLCQTCFQAYVWSRVIWKVTKEAPADNCLNYFFIYLDDMLGEGSVIYYVWTRELKMRHVGFPESADSFNAE